jgi:hypothetical protein
VVLGSGPAALRKAQGNVERNRISWNGHRLFREPQASFAPCVS